MDIDAATATTYALLGLAMAMAWLKPIPVTGSVALPPWLLVFAASCCSAIVGGLVTWQGMLALMAFAALASLAHQLRAPAIFKAALLLATGWMTLALSVHKFAGFANPALFTNLQVSAGAPAYTYRLNFDTTAAGLILFAIFCIPARSREAWREVFRQYPVIIGTPLVVLACGLALGFVQIDPKLAAYTPLFLVCNLLFTCVTEEAFFRGFIQQQLTVGLKRFNAGPYIAMLVAAILFGIAHAKGGPLLIGLATLAGLGNGYAYLRSQRIEAAILTHFVLNALHFLAFTYPRTL